MEDSLTLPQVSKRLKIGLATARSILRKYKRLGTFPMKKFRERNLMRSQNNLNNEDKGKKEKEYILQKNMMEESKVKMNENMTQI